MPNEKDVDFTYQDNVNLFYCDRCNSFLIAEFNDREPKECGCSCEHEKGILKPIIECDDSILRRGLQDALNQLNDLIAFRIAMSISSCDECDECEEDDEEQKEPEEYKN